MRFSLIFIERSTKPELMEFCEEVLHSAKNFLLASRKLKEKIGGVYLLYGLYYRMPVGGPKIRMTMNDWEIVLNLQSELIHHHEYQAVYILNQLIENNAFVYCTFEHERRLENYYSMKEFIKRDPQPKSDLISIFDDLKKQSKNYVDLKNASEQMTGEDIPRLFKMENITKMVGEIENLNNVVVSKKTTVPVKTTMSLRSSGKIDISKPSTSHENFEDLLPSTSKDNGNTLNLKMECSGDTESSEESSDSDD
ncbi:snRNA-activating protein complex subunit 1 isoform X2 [Chelonus insularis]|nr:snRNA-activating protein complex subunit 1-like isoform X2 [Chelonus insularis]